MSSTQNPYWNISVTENLTKLQSSETGLSSDEADKRIKIHGYNQIAQTSEHKSIILFLKQFKSPITLLLLVAALLSLFLGEKTDSVIIFIIVGISNMLGFWQEKNAGDAVKKLLSLVEVKGLVLRDGNYRETTLKEIIPGDIVKLSAGDVVPADCLIITSNELFTSEAAFTGESFPVEKKGGLVPSDSPLSKRTNSLFMGSHVISGTATALVIKTGIETEFGNISKNLKTSVPETDFEKGIRQLGYLLMQLTLFLLVIIFFINTLLHKPVLDSFLFALALAVGLTPQLLPAIISINLAKGAKQLAKQQVIVKKLSSIECLGSMNVLCSDKTGTLTEGTVVLSAALNTEGKESAETLFYAGINATLQQGFKNAIDTAIIEKAPKEVNTIKRIDEIPYDFIRKRLSILAALPEGNVLIVKGALTNILEKCTAVKTADGEIKSIASYKENIQQKFKQFSDNGYRTLGLAIKKMNTSNTIISHKDEEDLVFVGFLTFYDPVKSDALSIIEQLKNLGISLKVITGDNVLVAKHLGQSLKLENLSVLSGKEMTSMSQDALISKVNNIQIFAEVEPNQKERIIQALKKSGKVVGYMGDGINDANALHTADVGISVNTAVDVAKEAADLVLLDKDLSVLINGVKEGRKVFTNTIKYIFMATSANFGNMFSMAGASILLPFLPLLPKQVLLTNLLTDFPSMAIATDNIDLQDINQPRKWDIKFIKRFMIIFGFLSSLFDFITFVVLLKYLHAGEKEFQTGWFIESVVSATLIVLVVRTKRFFFKSLPGNYLLYATIFTVCLVCVLPFLPLAPYMGFIYLSADFYIPMLLIVFMYLLFAEITKTYFFKLMKQS